MKSVLLSSTDSLMETTQCPGMQSSQTEVERIFIPIYSETYMSIYTYQILFLKPCRIYSQPENELTADSYLCSAEGAVSALHHCAQDFSDKSTLCTIYHVLLTTHTLTDLPCFFFFFEFYCE